MKLYIYAVRGTNDPIEKDQVIFNDKGEAIEYAKEFENATVDLLEYENGIMNIVCQVYGPQADELKAKSDEDHNSCRDTDCPEGSECNPIFDKDDLDECDYNRSEESNSFTESMLSSAGFKIGDRIHITRMEGEDQYTDKEGTVTDIDDLGQLHGTWGGCALIPNVDVFEKIEDLSSQSTSLESYVTRRNEEGDQTPDENYVAPSKDIPVNQCTIRPDIAHTDDELDTLEDEEKVLKTLAPKEKYTLAEEDEVVNEEAQPSVDQTIDDFENSINTAVKRVDFELEDDEVNLDDAVDSMVDGASKDLEENRLDKVTEECNEWLESVNEDKKLEEDVDLKEQGLVESSVDSILNDFENSIKAALETNESLEEAKEENEEENPLPDSAVLLDMFAKDLENYID